MLDPVFHVVAPFLQRRFGQSLYHELLPGGARMLDARQNTRTGRSSEPRLRELPTYLRARVLTTREGMSSHLKAVLQLCCPY